MKVVQMWSARSSSTYWNPLRNSLSGARIGPHFARSWSVSCRWWVMHSRSRAREEAYPDRFLTYPPHFKEGM